MPDSGDGDGGAGTSGRGRKEQHFILFFFFPWGKKNHLVDEKAFSFKDLLRGP